jgi:DMSO/TMAO reductase YedYZ molybdopterin-dependent catalytic subunit
VSTQAGRAFRGAVAGLAALAMFLGAAELVVVATGPASAPAIAIGQVVISHTPQTLKEFAIQHFGASDKDVLLGGIYTSFIVLAGFAGALAALTRRAVAVAGAGIFAFVGAISAATQPTASWLDALPSLAGGLAAAVTVGLLISDRRPRPLAQLATSPQAQGPAYSRRQFLVAGSSLFAVGAGAYLLGARAVSTVYNAARSRAAVRLPMPVSATRRARGTSFDAAGLAPYITANKDFYRVDTALVVPQLSTEGYGLALHGMVDRPAIFTFEDILGMGLVERTITMVCVSNPVGGPYIGNARWLGVPLKDVLEKSGLQPGADQLFMTSSDGMTIGADLAAVMDGRPAMLALGMNGEPLPFEHGFPVRAIIPGIYGYASACKWLVDLEVTTFTAKKAYWVERGYAEKAPIKLESKIDTPASFARLPAGMVSVAGSAWHPGVGISKVEVNVDNGPWHQAVLAAVESVDTWRLWRWDWHATPGTHSLGARATDATGLVQTPADTGVVPNGASGRQSVVVTIA